MKNQYRIGDNTLLRMNYNLSEKESFYTKTDGNIIQYLHNQVFIEQTVWKFNTKINKVFNSLNLFDFAALTLVPNTKIITGSLLLRQGFSWENVFGVLLVIKSTGNQFTEKIIISQLYNIDNFSINADDSRELINGSFWTKHIDFIIPDLGENMMVSIETIMFSDVDSSGITIGRINNYPSNDTSYEPLISEEPIPDYIQVDVEITNSQYVNITPKTLELNKTIEQSIADYFSLSNNIVSVSVSHIIKYGNDTFGYKTIRLSNEDYKFGPVSVGLDLSVFENSTNFVIFVSTEIVANNKLLKREQSVIFNYNDLINPIIQNLINPLFIGQTLFPVEVKSVQNITNTVIETKTETKIVPIFQPVFIEIIKQDFLFENKNISFENDIKVDSYLIIKTPEEQFILSKTTIEGVIYYDLANVIKPLADCEYEIINAIDKKLIQKGMIKI